MEKMKEKYSILTRHTRILDMNEVYKVLPKDVIFITILRDSATHFQSAFDYFDYGNQWELSRKGRKLSNF